MKLKIYPELILRVPQFHLNAILEDEWEELKESIKNSSQDFYQTIAEVSANELDKLPRSVYHSIWKYFNRAKYRATPYGSFAGFGVVHKEKADLNDFIKISDRHLLHWFICWTNHKKYANKKRLTRNTILFANSSYYKVGDRLRYIVTSEDSTFELNEAEAITAVLEILENCRKPIVLDLLIQKNNWNTNKLALIDEMIGLQLLLTDQAPNIIGPDYFERIGKRNLTEIPKYILAERKIESGYPAQDALQHIPDLIRLMDKLIKEFRSPVLDHFKTEFKTKFERLQVLLMKALDPELGISIISNEDPVEENTFINSFVENRNVSPQQKEQVLETLLLKSVYETAKKPIRLECIEHEFESQSGKLPNTIGMLCSIVDSQIIVENIGGASAISILGRYTIASEVVTDICNELASIEQDANPDVLFFDIGYISEISADNVNRRSQIYPYQLSILNFDTSADPITLEDLYVSVVNDEIVLSSKRLKKRMIPRLSTAYNYNRSDLPLFRFLCELQYQGLKANLGFNLSALVPGMSCYPRVQYRNIVLSPAKWIVSHADLTNHLNASVTNTIKSYLKALGMSDYVLTRTDDRTLCFCLESEIDMRELQYMIRKFDRFCLEEGFIPKRSAVRDTAERCYANQFVISLHQGTKVYDTLNVPLTSTQMQGSFPAGTEWLYYEIYTHPLRSDYLLQDKISVFLKAHRRSIECWFFVRYSEGGEHIRLRMKLKNLNLLGPIMVDLAQRLERELTSGLIADYKINRYQREMERYSPELMEHTEYLFFKDSRYVIALLQTTVTDYDKYLLCIDLMFQIRATEVIDNFRFDQMMDRTSDYFLAEHTIVKADYKRLNMEYKIIKDRPVITLPKTITKQYNDFELTFLDLLSRCPEQDREKLFTDLMHMHINRLFSVRQRTHEMVIYYFAVKRLLYKRSVLKTSVAV